MRGGVDEDVSEVDEIVKGKCEIINQLIKKRLPREIPDRHFVSNLIQFATVLLPVTDGFDMSLMTRVAIITF